ncbi:MAG: phosphodiester glycosidase family protein [Paludibacteraceae bacterium]
MKKLYPFFFLFLSFSICYAGNIVIDGRSYRIDTVANFKVGPGTYYTAVELRGAKRLNVFFLKSDLTNPYISYKSALGGDSIYSTERPTDVAKRKSKKDLVYFAGTNGDFYNTAATYYGMPTGGSMVESEMGTRAISYPVMAIDENKVPYIGIMAFSGSVSFNGNTYSIAHTNHLRNKDELVLYNKLNGKYTHTNPYGTEVLIQLQAGETWGVNKMLKGKVINMEINVGNMKIPEGYAVLSGHGVAQTFLNALAVNDEVDIIQNVTIDGASNPYSEVVAGDHRTMMLKNGVPTTDQVWADLHPRTGFGYSKDKKTAYHCVVDGRGVSAGASTKELAELMLSAGAYEAVNLDGGGSSCLFVRNFGSMNTPSDGSERAVANGIYIVSSAPSDNEISEICAYETAIKLPRYGVFKPKFLGYNQYGMLVNTDVQSVALSCDENVGLINDKGEFVASGGVDGILTAHYNGIGATVRIEIVTDAAIAIRLDSVLIDSRKEYPVEVQSIIGLNTMLVYPDALTWSVKDPEVCSMAQGVLRGLKNGETMITGSLGTYKDSMKVVVEIPQSGTILFDDISIDNWTLESSPALNAKISNDNLPTGWSTGAVVDYVFAATRAPYLKFIHKIPFYSLPDTMKIGLNMGDVMLSKMVLSLKANNATQSTTKEYANFLSNTDTEIVLPLDNLFDTKDMAVYPVWLEYLNFYLAAQTSGHSYRLGIKNITLCYNGYDITYTSPEKMSDWQIYPNPVKEEINIHLKNSYSNLIKIKLYDLSGQIINAWNFSNYSTNIRLPIKELNRGAYLIQISGQDNVSETIKIIKK